MASQRETPDRDPHRAPDRSGRGTVGPGAGTGASRGMMHSLGKSPLKSKKSPHMADTPFIAALDAARKALCDAEQQIEYLHRKFKATGSGNAVLVQIKQTITRIDTVLAAVEPSSHPRPNAVAATPAEESRAVAIQWRPRDDDLEMTAYVGDRRVGGISVWTDNVTGDVVYWSAVLAGDTEDKEICDVFDSPDKAKEAVAAAVSACMQISKKSEDD
jgi:hypothetical protein